MATSSTLLDQTPKYTSPHLCPPARHSEAYFRDLGLSPLEDTRNLQTPSGHLTSSNRSPRLCPKGNPLWSKMLHLQGLPDPLPDIFDGTKEIQLLHKRTLPPLRSRRLCSNGAPSIPQLSSDPLPNLGSQAGILATPSSHPPPQFCRTPGRHFAKKVSHTINSTPAKQASPISKKQIEPRAQHLQPNFLAHLNRIPPSLGQCHQIY
jgi:hypothetical protein